MIQNYYSNGKLLITAEYVVLEGAQALAFPTKFGQSLQIQKSDSATINWISKNKLGEIWYQDEFAIQEVDAFKKTTQKTDNTFTYKILELLSEAKKQNPNFLNSSLGNIIITELDFPRNWGLGSSSTLINNIATWAEIDAFELSRATFGGSGYDIAAAQHNKPILYTTNKVEQRIKEITIDWNFTDQLFFVHLNQKQNSREGIKKFYSNARPNTDVISEINEITLKISTCQSLDEFENLLTHHEEIISTILGQKTVKQALFPDYPGIIKSLGAWGGDFILATGNSSNKNYFIEKGYTTLLSFQEMIL